VPLHTKIVGKPLALAFTGRRFGRVLKPALLGVLFERHKSLYILYLHLNGLYRILKAALGEESHVWHLAFGKAT
jgi:hypothetical protein